MAGSVLLLLLASLNVAGLLLARGAARAREFTTRMAIGATRGRIAGQLLVESLLIALAGGVFGLLAAPAVAARDLVVPAAERRGRASASTAGSWPSRSSRASSPRSCAASRRRCRRGRTPLVASLNDRSRVAAGGGVRLRKVLVAGQLAFTLVLLVGSGLFVQTVARLHGNLGFDSDNLVTVVGRPAGERLLGARRRAGDA